MTPCTEAPKFVFNKGPTTKEHQDEKKPISNEAAQDPMAMIYKEKVGWVAECLSPKSGHWKRMARENWPKDGIEQQSPSEDKPIVQYKLKRESPVPLKELELNLTEAKCSKGQREIKAAGKENTNTDGREAATTTQCRRAQ